MTSETLQAEIFMSLVAMKLPEQVLIERLKTMLTDAKQSGLDAGYDQALMDRYSETLEK